MCMPTSLVTSTSGGLGTGVIIGIVVACVVAVAALAGGGWFVWQRYKG